MEVAGSSVFHEISARPKRFVTVTLLITGGMKSDRKSTRLNSSHTVISYAVFCLKKKKPRSFSTAYRSRLNFVRFINEYRPAIFDRFTMLYAVARWRTDVSDSHIRSFCRNIETPN